MAIFTSAIALKSLFKAIARSRKVAEQVNQTCSAKGLPLAFPANENGEFNIPGNPDYQFEGFGTVVGIPPQVSFWVHYKPNTSEHVALGQFTVPIGF